MAQQNYTLVQIRHGEMPDFHVFRQFDAADDEAAKEWVVRKGKLAPGFRYELMTTEVYRTEGESIAVFNEPAAEAPTAPKPLPLSVLVKQYIKSRGITRVQYVPRNDRVTVVSRSQQPEQPRIAEILGIADEGVIVVDATAQDLPKKHPNYKTITWRWNTFVFLVD